MVIFQSEIKCNESWKALSYLKRKEYEATGMKRQVYATDYLKKIRKRDEELHFYLGTICPQVGAKFTVPFSEFFKVIGRIF